MKSYKVALGIALVSTVAIGTVIATDQTVDVNAKLRKGITFTKNSDIDFTTGSNTIDFTGTPADGTDAVDLGADGNHAIEGTVFTVNGSSAAGSYDMFTDGASAVNISCSTGATMAAATSSTLVIAVDNLQLSVQGTAATGAYDSGAATHEDYICAGVGTTPLSYTPTAGTRTVTMGGRMRGNNTIITDAYSTTTGGTPATLEVVYQ